MAIIQGNEPQCNPAIYPPPTPPLHGFPSFFLFGFPPPFASSFIVFLPAYTISCQHQLSPIVVLICLPSLLIFIFVLSE